MRVMPYSRYRPKFSWAFEDGANEAGLDACLIHVERALAVPLSSTSRDAMLLIVFSRMLFLVIFCLLCFVMWC